MTLAELIFAAISAIAASIAAVAAMRSLRLSADSAKSSRKSAEAGQAAAEGSRAAADAGIAAVAEAQAAREAAALEWRRERVDRIGGLVEELFWNQATETTLAYTREPPQVRSILNRLIQVIGELRTDLPETTKLVDGSGSDILSQAAIARNEIQGWMSSH